MKASHVPQSKLHQKLIQATQVIIALVKEKKKLNHTISTHRQAASSIDSTVPHQPAVSQKGSGGVSTRTKHPQIPLATHVAQNSSSEVLTPLPASPQSPPPHAPLKNVSPAKLSQQDNEGTVPALQKTSEEDVVSPHQHHTEFHPIKSSGKYCQDKTV